MAEVLRPSLELFGVELQFIGELDQRAPQRMRIEIRYPASLQASLKYCPNRVRVRPMRPIETNGAKFEIFAGPDLRFGKEGIFWSEAFSLAQEGDPFDERRVGGLCRLGKTRS